MATKTRELRRQIHNTGNRVILRNMAANPYGSTSKQFCKAKLVEEDRVYVEPDPRQTWYTCREELAGAYYETYEKDQQEKPLTVILLRGFNLENLRAGVRALNVYERRFRWAQSFVALTDDDNTLVFIGSRYWRCTVPHLSLVCLFLRLMSVYPVEANEQMTAYLKRMSDWTNGYGDRNLLKSLLAKHPDMVYIMMKHKLTLTRTLDSKQAQNNGSGHVGINEATSRAERFLKNQYTMQPNWHMKKYIETLADFLKKYEGKEVKPVLAKKASK